MRLARHQRTAVGGDMVELIPFKEYSGYTGQKVQTQEAQIYAEWSAWSEDLDPPDGFNPVSAELSIAAYPVTTATLRGAVDYAVKNAGMAPFSVAGFDAGCRSSALHDGNPPPSAVAYNVVANGSLVSLIMAKRHVGGREDFPVSTDVLAERILRIVGARLAGGPSPGTGLPGVLPLGFSNPSWYASSLLGGLSFVQEFLTLPSQARARRDDEALRRDDEAYLEEIRQGIGLNLGRYERFLTVVGPQAAGTHYSKVREVINKLRATGIPPLPEPPPDPAGPKPVPQYQLFNRYWATGIPPLPEPAPAPSRVPELSLPIPQPPTLPSPVDQILRAARQYDKMPPDAQREFVAKIREVWPKLSPEDRARFPAWLRKMMGN